MEDYKPSWYMQTLHNELTYQLRKLLIENKLNYNGALYSIEPDTSTDIENRKPDQIRVSIPEEFGLTDKANKILSECLKRASDFS